MWPLNFEKNFEFLQKNPDIFPGFSKDTLKINMDFIPMKLNKNVQ